MKVELTARTLAVVQHKQLTLDEYIIWVARISSPDNRDNHDTGAKLMQYLMKHKHWSPFEMISFAFQIKTSRAIAQQILRHRSFSFQEFSQRYAEATELEPVEFRLQAETNRQSSTKVAELNDAAKIGIGKHYNNCLLLYQNLVDEGVAKECARMVLPLSTQTTLVMHGTLRSWIHFIEQRCNEHAQKEIRLIAFEIRNQLAIQVPQVAEAIGWGNADSGGG